MTALRVLLLLPVALLVACPKPAAPEPVAPPEAQVRVPPGFTCPEDADLAGAAYPDALRLWCVRELPSGHQVEHGPVYAWHANGQYATMGAFADGRRSGVWTRWYPNGRPQSEIAYVHGVEDGIQVRFYASGQKESQGLMVEGQPDGSWTYWTEDGLHRTEGHWVLGVRNGVWREVGVDGQVTMERVFRDGRLVRQRSYE